MKSKDDQKEDGSDQERMYLLFYFFIQTQNTGNCNDKCHLFQQRHINIFILLYYF